MGLAGGKNVLRRRSPLSLILITSFLVHFVTGSLIWSVGMCNFTASIGGVAINFDACQILESSSSLSHSSQWVVLVFLRSLAYLLRWFWYCSWTGWDGQDQNVFAHLPSLVLVLFSSVSLCVHHLLE